MGKGFIGRTVEKEALNKYIESNKNELIAVYGRRRVGKTYLIREVLEDIIDFSFTGMYQESAANQRKQFQKELDDRTGEKSKKPSDWQEAFHNLKKYLTNLKKDRVVVFLDELPWMDTVKSDFFSAFSYFWNGWGNKNPKLKLIVCGSSTTWMVSKLIGDPGGLYGRITKSIYLAPFNLYETGLFLNEVKEMGFGERQILDVYMIMGGIPYYLDMLDRHLPLSVNIDRLFFATNAPLRTEYDFLFRSLFKNSKTYVSIVELLSTKLSGLTREEISAGSGLSGGDLTEVLKNLCACDFLRCYHSPGKNCRDKIYQLTDMYSLFYLRFIKNENGQDENYWTNLGQSGKKNAWVGYAFEQVCLHHVKEIKKALGISGILSNVYSFRTKPFVDGNGTEWNGGQIDLIIDRADGVMNLCEMKYSGEEYVIDKKYEETLRERMHCFKVVSKTNKALRCTFVTIYGVKKNTHYGIVNDDLSLSALF